VDQQICEEIIRLVRNLRFYGGDDDDEDDVMGCDAM
jgi:hypothetical protein